MAKQTNKKPTVKKTAVKPVPVMEHRCGSDCPCGCHRHGAGHRVKHVVALLIIFVLGYACGRTMCFRHAGIMMGPAKMHHPVFTNGCLDMKSVQCPKMQETLMSADINGDGCISVEEYKAFKVSKFGKKRGMFKNMKRSFHGAKMARQAD